MKADLHMERSRECLEEAQLMLENDKHYGTCNRAYYAVFEASRAILAAVGISPSKTHRGLSKLFYEHIVKQGLIDKETANILKKTEQLRIKADYLSVTDTHGKSIMDKEAKSAYMMASGFVQAIESKLDTI